MIPSQFGTGVRLRMRGLISRFLARTAPGVRKRLQAMARKANPAGRFSTKWERRPDAPPAGHSDLHPVLADPSLLALERPQNVEALVHNLRSSASTLDLEPVVDLSQMRQGCSVCFVVAVRRADPAALERTIQSVLRQTAPEWEIQLAASEAMNIEPWLDIDWRIRRLDGFGHETEAGCLRGAAVQATTTYIGLLSQGDLIDDDLVRSLGERTKAAPEADLVYTDEALRLEDGRHGQPFYKPDWSPEHQQSVNMLGRFVAIRRSLVFRSEPAPAGMSCEATEYALNLAVARRAARIVHIDEPLYVRGMPTSGRAGGFFSASALDDARQVLEAQARHECAKARVVVNAELGSLHVRWPAPAEFPVTLLILTGLHRRELPGRGDVVLALNFVRSIIEKSSASGYSIVVVDDGERDEELEALLARHGHRSETYREPGPFSFAHKANFATSLAPPGIVVLLNDDLEVISPDWIEALAGQAARPHVGAVGARLLFADGTLQHAGVGLGMNESAGHMFHRVAADGQEYGGFASVDRNSSAVTGAVLAYRKEVFDALGGFDEVFRTDYNDLDFCLRCIERGLRVVYTPAATLFHFHNSSIRRTSDSTPERAAFLSKWASQVSRDPYFSKNFQLRSADLSLV